jgi:hypothetical protein
VSSICSTSLSTPHRQHPLLLPRQLPPPPPLSLPPSHGGMHRVFLGTLSDVACGVALQAW